MKRKKHLVVIQVFLPPQTMTSSRRFSSEVIHYFFTPNKQFESYQHCLGVGKTKDKGLLYFPARAGLPSIILPTGTV